MFLRVNLEDERNGGKVYGFSCFCRLILGYAYPAFECYKTVEKNRVEIEELRFWCQYW